MKILVTGANGQLGREMRIVGRETDHEFVFTDVVEAEGVQTTLLDITDPEAIRRIVREERIDCVVNCAAYTNVDKAESDEAFCRVLNAEAPASGRHEGGERAVDPHLDGLCLRRRSLQYALPGGAEGNSDRSLRTDQTRRRTAYPRHGVQVCHSAYGVALFGVRAELRQDDAQPHVDQTAAEGRVRPGRHADLCL